MGKARPDCFGQLTAQLRLELCRCNTCHVESQLVASCMLSNWAQHAPGFEQTHVLNPRSPSHQLSPDVVPARRWTVHSLKVVMLIGQAVSLAPAVVLFLFDDDKSLGEESNPLTSRPPSMRQLGAPSTTHFLKDWHNMASGPTSGLLCCHIDVLLLYVLTLRGCSRPPLRTLQNVSLVATWTGQPCWL